MFHSLEEFHHYCFAHEESIIMYDTMLVSNLEKDAASLSHKLEIILIRIHQYNMKILYKPEPHISYCLS